MFPLGEFSKPKVREISEGFNLSVATKKESQDVCFIAKDYRTFIEKNSIHFQPKGGVIKEGLSASSFSAHEGIHNFTIGQRRKLGINSQEAMYVVNINFDNSDIIVGSETDLYSDTLYAKNLNWSMDRESILNLKLKAKVRYRSPESEVSIDFKNDGRLLVKFKKPQRALTPGQAIVFYKNEKVIGGGWIDQAI